MNRHQFSPLDQFGLVATLEKVPWTPVPSGHAPGVGREQPLHTMRKIGGWSTDQKMEVIGHQHEADEFPAGSGDLSSQ
jgi:hypothetical protein